MEPLQAVGGGSANDYADSLRDGIQLTTPANGLNCTLEADSCAVNYRSGFRRSNAFSADISIKIPCNTC
jgi:hypothetical protein